MTSTQRLDSASEIQLADDSPLAQQKTWKVFVSRVAFSLKLA